MATNVPIPPMGESIPQVTLLRWIKNEGDYVRIDEALAELETDKANAELPAPVAGVLHQSRKAGETIKVGEVVGSIDESAAAPAGKAAPVKTPVPATTSGGASPQLGNAPSAAPPSPARAAAGQSDLSDMNPSTRRQVEENKLDPSQIPATGPHGRLLGSDVATYLQQPSKSEDNRQPDNGRPLPGQAGNGAASPSAPVPAPLAEPQPTAPVAAPGGAGLSRPQLSSSAPLQFDASGLARVAMSNIRKRTAINLKQAQNTAAILTTFNEADMTAISELRARHKERFEKTYGVGLGFMSFFARAVVLGLREFARVNASLDGDDVVYHNYVNLGIAVSTDRGLTVPILKHAELMSFAKVESEIKRMANAVREGNLGLAELGGGTFTITNGGVFGSLLSTPILNPPQSAILGMHTIQKRPVAVGDKVEVHPMMYVALSYDHRLIDGRESVSFLVRVKEYLEDPARLMLEI